MQFIIYCIGEELIYLETKVYVEFLKGDKPVIILECTLTGWSDFYFPCIFLCVYVFATRTGCFYEKTHL